MLRRTVKQTTLNMNEYSGMLRQGLAEKMRYGDLDILYKPTNSTSEEFLKEITYRINLKKLYNIVDTCYINNRMPFCPILV